MASPARAPEQIIREWLDRNGATRVGLEALEQTWGLDRLDASDRRRIAEALDGAGVEIYPPLQRVARSDKVTLSVRAAEPEPAAEPRPDPARAPAPPDVRRRAGRKARALLNRTPPPARPAPASPAREEALRADAAREQARQAREREHREREDAAARARDEAERVSADEQARAHEQAETAAERERETAERERTAAEAEYRHERERARVWAAEQAAAAPAPPEVEPEADQAPAAPISRRTIGLIGAGVALMILGSLGPWAKAVFVTDYGIDRSGLAVIAAALFAGAALFLHLRRGRDSWLPLLTAAAAAFAAALVAGDFRDLVDDSFVSPTWGLYMAFLGSVMVAGVSMALLVRRR